MVQATIPDPSPRHVERKAFSEWLEIYGILKGQIEPYSIYKLSGIKPDLVAFLEDAGITPIDRIPADAKRSPAQSRQVAATRSGERFVDRESIPTFSSDLNYPLYFLDYETFSDVLPPFDGLRPYQQVPFQYSLHVLE